MHMHIEAMFVHRNELRIERVNDWTAGMAPRFYLARTREGNQWRFRDDLSADLVLALIELCEEEPLLGNGSDPPRHEQAYLELLSSKAPIESVWGGPMYSFVSAASPQRQPVQIDSSNKDLLHGGMQDWIPDVVHQQPFMAMIEDGRAVSVCASVRITDRAHAAGVETLPDYRHRGFARDVVSGWAREVQRLNAVALYSTSWDNAASQRVAENLCLQIFGAEFHIT